MELRRRVSRTIAMVRYHRLSQFCWRLYRLIQRKSQSVLPDKWVFHQSSTTTRMRPDAKQVCVQLGKRRLRLWPERDDIALEICQGNFRFLNVSSKLTSKDDDLTKACWQPNAPRLWKFHLQCQEYLLPMATHRVDCAYDLLRGWLAQPEHRLPHLLPDAWHPFCISRRLPVWLCFAALHGLPPDLEENFWRSISDQRRWLNANLELDLGGNHLLENLTALFLAECFLEAMEGEQVPSESLSERLAHELTIQVLKSGEHCERSPTYHCLALFCVLQMAEAAKFREHSIAQKLVATAASMASWLEYVIAPDGSIPLLSDSAMAETPQPKELLAWTDHLTERDSTDSCVDYWVDRRSDTDVLIFDRGNLACDHLPAHAHADMTQVIGWYRGRNVIVDSGNFDYETSEMRRYCRSTAAHNVLQVDGEDQCDMWSRFRMGRRGHMIWSAEGAVDEVRWAVAAHDGFRHVGVPVTGRVVLSVPQGWTIIDWIHAKGNHQLTSRIHLHPDFVRDGITFPSPTSARLGDFPAPMSAESLRKEASWYLESGWYCPDFGIRTPTSVLSLSELLFGNTWIGWQFNFDANNPAPSVEVIDVSDSLHFGISDGQIVEISIPDFVRELR